MAWVKAQAEAAWVMLTNLFPAPPAVLGTACEQLAAVVGWIGPVAGFLPLPELAVGLVLWLAGVVAGVGIIVARIGVSYVTLGGGGT